MIFGGYGCDNTYLTQSSSMASTFTRDGSLLLGCPSKTWRVSFACLSTIPDGLLEDYVRALVMTYVGYTGGSIRYSRTDFYANEAALRIPRMFQAFDDKAGAAFVEAIRATAS